MRVSRSIVSDFLRPHASLPVIFSRQEYWSGLHSLLQRNFPTQGLNPGLLHCRQILYYLSYRDHWGNLSLFLFMMLENVLYYSFTCSCPVFQHNLLKRLSFPVVYKCVGLFLGSLFCSIDLFYRSVLLISVCFCASLPNQTVLTS